MKRKIAKGSVLLFLVFFLVACEKELREVKYNYKIGKFEISSTYLVRGNEITQQISTVTVPYFMMDVSNEEEAKVKTESVLELVANVKGMEYKVKYEDVRIVQEFKIDYSEADPVEVSKITGIAVYPNNSGKVNFEKTEEILLKGGYKKID